MLEIDFMWLAIGIAAAGYFIGQGIKNFNNPDAKGFLDDLDDDDDHELIRDKDLHYFIGISKEDGKALIEEHKDIPHIVINNNVYFPKAKLREWLKQIGE